MALGSSDLDRIKLEKEKIKDNCDILGDSLDVFQNVTKSLSDWADDTVIGSDIKYSLETLNNSLDKLLRNTKVLYEDIDDYIEKQYSINRNL